MAYIGAQPNKSLTKTTSQSFNGTGSATVFTLNRAVNTGEELEVFVDNVQQEPGSGKSYTATGTTLTFDEAPPSGTGNVYVIYRGLAEVTTRLEHDANQALSATTGTFTSLNVPTIKDSSGTNTAMTIDSSGRILTPARPAFSCRPNGAMNFITQAGWKTTVFQTVDFDIGSNLNAGGYFVCPVTGIYQFNLHMRFDSVGTSYVIICLASELSGTSTPTSNANLYFNSYVINGSPNSSYDSLSTSLTISMTAGDNVMPWHYSADTFYTVATASSFSGFLVG